MKQQTFATADFERYRKPTRREQFLAEMDSVVSWKQLCEVIEPFYPKAGNGRPPVGPVGTVQVSDEKDPIDIGTVAEPTFGSSSERFLEKYAGPPSETLRAL